MDYSESIGDEMPGTSYSVDKKTLLPEAMECVEKSLETDRGSKRFRAYQIINM